jgi:hypothetical protein
LHTAAVCTHRWHFCTTLLAYINPPPHLPSIHLAKLPTGLFVVITLAKHNLERLKFGRAVKGKITEGRDWEFLSCDITIHGTSFRSLTIVTNWLGPVSTVIKCVTPQHCQRPNLWPKTIEVEHRDPGVSSLPLNYRGSCTVITAVRWHVIR